MAARGMRRGFSALQRAEIAEILPQLVVLRRFLSFSALQRAEIAEIVERTERTVLDAAFQCSSTSRNC